jgi:hypothetical protein
MRMRSVNTRSTLGIFVFPPMLYNVDDTCVSPKFAEHSKKKLLKIIEKPYVDIVSRSNMHLSKEIPRSLEVIGDKSWESVFKIQCTVTDSNNIFGSSFNTITGDITLRPNKIQNEPISGSITLTYELYSSNFDGSKYVYDTFTAIMPYKFIKPSLKFISSEINGSINIPLDSNKSLIILTDSNGEPFDYIPGVILDIKIKNYENKIPNLYTQEFPNGAMSDWVNAYTKYTYITIARYTKKNN